MNDPPDLFRFRSGTKGQEYIWKLLLDGTHHLEDLFEWSDEKSEELLSVTLREWLDTHAPGHIITSPRASVYIIVFAEENHALAFKMMFGGKLIEDPEDIEILHELYGIRTA